MFTLSKIFDNFLRIDCLTLFILALIIVLLYTRFWRWGRGIALALLILRFISYDTIAFILLKPFETLYQPPRTLPPHIKGIIVLGGAVEPILSHSYPRTVLSGGAGDRLLAAIELHQRYPKALILYSGGTSSLLHPSLAEAPLAKDIFKNSGIAPDLLYSEDKSRNTHENALYSFQMMHPKPDEVWILVTSAYHMPRSINSFRAYGWNVIAYPVDYAPSSPFSAMIHEFAGLAYYQARGWFSLTRPPHPPLE